MTCALGRASIRSVPLITDVEQIAAIFREAGRRRAALPTICTENREATEAIFEGIARAARRHGIARPPLVIAFTAHYPGRSNLLRYTSRWDMREGFLAARDDILRLSRPDGPYGHLQVVVHLDHGQPQQDGEVLEWGRGLIGSLMFDATSLPLAENIEATAAFVRERGGDFFVEGAVDEVMEASGAVTGRLTSPEEAERYLKQTGCRLICINVGTEHRAPAAGRARYRGELARSIGERVGPVLCLHGSSSLSADEFGRLADDGIVKVNIWTALERVGGQAIARDAIEQADSILPGEELTCLARAGLLGPRMTERAKAARPVLDLLTHTHRRNEVWSPTVTRLVEGYCEALGFARLAGGLFS